MVTKKILSKEEQIIEWRAMGMSEEDILTASKNIKQTKVKNMVEEQKEKEKQKAPSAWTKIKCTGCGKEKVCGVERFEKLKTGNKIKDYKCRECRKAK